MQKISRVITVVAIALGLALLTFMLTQMITDRTSRHADKWEKATAGYVQEGPSPKPSEGD